MTTAWVVTSAIDCSAEPLNYSPTRSVFSAEERCRQTLATLATIDGHAHDGDVVYVVDASEDPDRWRVALTPTGVVYVSVREAWPDIYGACRTHPNKSHSEALMLDRHLDTSREALAGYDRTVKVSGRYLMGCGFDRGEWDDPTIGVLFKPAMAWHWKPGWDFSLVDRRDVQGDDTLRQYCSALWGWRTSCAGIVRELLREAVAITRDQHYDMETLLYYLTRPHEAMVGEADWIISGWGGTTGAYCRY